MSRLPVLASLVLLLVGLSGCGGAGLGSGGSTPQGGPPPSSGQTMSAHELGWAMEVLDLVNAERTSRQLGALAWDATAAQVAYDHCVDMQVRGYFDHDTPEGWDPGERMSYAGIDWWTWGENIARGQNDPQAVMTSWMNSSGHRANILNANFTYLGVGVHEAPNGPWWNQDFFAR
jgi:uncharacterized protein YkwD